MLFSSPAFFVFLLVYFAVHIAVPKRFRLYLIIGGSTIFYAWWKIAYVWLPYLLMAIAYGGACWMEQARAPATRKRRAVITVTALFLPLIFFKYTDFIYRDVLGLVLDSPDRLLDLPLPLGISFVTFTLTAYVVDIYRGTFVAIRWPSTVLAYVLFFPHLIAGPILRPIELIPRLQRPRPALSAPFALGVAIFTIGLVKKLVLADQVAGVIDAVYNQPGAPSAPAGMLAIYGFSAQIYGDFSGYTDMAIGVALLLGIRLPINFLRPYGATSLIDFWRRWHITLSFWLRDYLYIPLGGSKHGRLRELRNILVTVALGGLWHGANWTFVVWGLLHGVGVSSVHLVRRGLGWTGQRLPNWVAVLVTFHFVTLAWVFFRAPSIARALQVLAAPLIGPWDDAGQIVIANLFPISLIVVFLLLHRYDDHRRIRAVLRKWRPEILWPVIGFLWAVAIAVSQGSSAKFIYFDF